MASYHDIVLIQFQCQKEGSLFYYQQAESSGWLVTHCPICGSKRVKATGRTFPRLNECEPIPEGETSER